MSLTELPPLGDYELGDHVIVNGRARYKMWCPGCEKARWTHRNGSYIGSKTIKDCVTCSRNRSKNSFKVGRRQYGE